MGRSCLNCGKPLGNRSALCHSCASAGVDPEAVTDVDEEVLERLERYFVVSAIKCANCDELHGTVTVDGESYTADTFGLESVADWEREMDAEEEWIRDHRDQVAAALVRLEGEWPHSVAAVRQHVLSE